jgi:hypothetical protein
MNPNNKRNKKRHIQRKRKGARSRNFIPSKRILLQDRGKTSSTKSSRVLERQGKMWVHHPW